MPEKERPPTLEDLDARLKKAREATSPKDRAGWPAGGLGRALRLVVEMAAALAVGAGLGWLLDRWLGTAPWLLIALTFVGIGAGVRNAFRAARRFEQDSDEKDKMGGGSAPR